MQLKSLKKVQKNNSVLNKKNSAEKKSDTKSYESLLKEVEILIKNLGYFPDKREIAQRLNIKGVKARQDLKSIIKSLKKDTLKKQSLRQRVFRIVEFDDANSPLVVAVSLGVEYAPNNLHKYTVSSSSIKQFQNAQVDDVFYGAVLPDQTVQFIRWDTKKDAKDLIYGLIAKNKDQVVFVPADRSDRNTYAIAYGEGDIEKSKLPLFATARVMQDQSLSVEIEKIIGDETKLYDFIIERRNLPRAFDQGILKSLEKEVVPPLGERKDLRQLPFVTIDGQDAKDFDDAVYAKMNPDGSWRLVVAIADVTHYLRSHPDLDKQAFERGNSIYFPGYVIPMLPEKLSNDLCSLKPQVDRAVLGADILVNKEGKKISHEFYSALIHSHARLTYKQVEQRMEGVTGHQIKNEALSAVDQLIGLHETLLKQRVNRGPLELESVELSFEFDKKGKVTGITNAPQLQSQQLIEEMMVLANQCAAETLSEAQLTIPYRIHEMPTAEKIHDFKQHLKSYQIKAGALTTPSGFNKILKSLDGHSLRSTIMDLCLRTQSKAVYFPSNQGHFGLNLSHYCHFTSPIRRYADVLVHRALYATISGNTKTFKMETDRHMKEWCDQLSELERRASQAEREVSDRLAAFFYAHKIGSVFKAVVSGISGAGIFVTLSDPELSGLVPMENLEDDYYILRKDPLHLKGRRRGRLYKIGQLLQVKLQEVDLARGRMNFSIDRPQEKTETKLKNPSSYKRAPKKKLPSTN